jgi:Cu-Zn family superoxide dismutase
MSVITMRALAPTGRTCVALFALVLGGGSALGLGEKAFSDMKGRDGRDHGQIKLIETTSGVLLRLHLKGLPPGAHGFHIHETGKCEGDFSSAGGIYNPHGAKHGFLNDEGSMVGDLPNLFATAAGEVETELLSPFVTLSRDQQETLFDADGSAFIIHERADDHRTEPEGNAGARIACGVITARK